MPEFQGPVTPLFSKKCLYADDHAAHGPQTGKGFLSPEPLATHATGKIPHGHTSYISV